MPHKVGPCVLRSDTVEIYDNSEAVVTLSNITIDGVSVRDLRRSWDLTFSDRGYLIFSPPTPMKVLNVEFTLEPHDIPVEHISEAFQGALHRNVESTIPRSSEPRRLTTLYYNSAGPSSYGSTRLVHVPGVLEGFRLPLTEVSNRPRAETKDIVNLMEELGKVRVETETVRIDFERSRLECHPASAECLIDGKSKLEVGIVSRKSKREGSHYISLRYGYIALVTESIDGLRSGKHFSFRMHEVFHVTESEFLNKIIEQKRSVIGLCQYLNESFEFRKEGRHMLKFAAELPA